MDAALIWEWIIKSVVILLVMTGGFAYVTLYERRVLARMQVRIGPNRVGWQGLLQPVADGIKLIFKEELTPVGADRLIFILAPVITVIPALIVTAVVPWGTEVNLFGRIVPLRLADINVAVLYILSVTSISVYGITLAGWSSNNKYAMLGGLRATAQMISYELALGMAFVGPILWTGSMSLGDIVSAQKNLWFVVIMPLGFIIYVIASLAEVNRSPFDMPEAEQELTAGYHTEYSGMKFALFFMAEYIKMIGVSMIGATLFLGGYQGPFVDAYPWLGPIYLFIKVALWLFFMIWVRATLPRFRYDRLMAFGWKVLLPLSLLYIVVTAVLRLLVGG
ncbi:NADH-quinone oxidoreductase subunit NuoH [Leptolinea tardivitalis]|uniref:NADH-quinone oxidoreductase subunit H n=1 Tax=Leptolinea tardivitalis TaxID=229920 RepID=A0A0P6WPB5_9CHLR|nr:NADH-quinone oxidoreductase subunit NuoH [Leptolinea tardivitalis]KPL70597.1 NADH-quinone oxidoreductase [Leptolinea tardivitalis]GAP22208.1 NADH:ubiquinone oxidoreductase subunit 11 [Leptolinea tardivitalis]